MLNVDSNNMYTIASRYYTHIIYILAVNHTKIQGLRFFGRGVAGFILASLFLLHLIGLPQNVQTLQKLRYYENHIPGMIY